MRSRKFALAALLFLLCLSACTSQLKYNSPKPEDAPENIREAVLLGRNIIMDPHKYIPDNTGNDMACKNCHFNAGQTQGGKNGGISLVGVGAVYPQYRERQKYSVNMTTRLND